MSTSSTSRRPLRVARPLHRAVLCLALLASSSVALATGQASSASAAPACSAFSSPVTDLVNPKTRAQLLSYRTKETTSFAANGYTGNRGGAFPAAASTGSGLSAVHRLYRKKTRDYFYSADAAEVSRAVAKSGYRDQGIAFYASKKSAGCLIAVYSFYRGGIHRYTTLPGERAALRDQGWTPEHIRFYVGRPQVDRAFTLGVMPDTQQEVLRAGDQRFIHRSRWLVANKSALDLRFVTHTGDVVNWDTTDHVQYKRAATALAPLRAGKIPYSLSPGNHDTSAVCAGGSACDPSRTRALVRKTPSFNNYLAANSAGLAGRFEANKIDNTFSTFQAGGAQWLVLNLELWPRVEAVAWAQRVVAAHPKYNVVIVTHSYLTSTGGIYTSSGYGGVSPRYLFDHLVKVYPNVRVVLSGHTGKAAARVDTGTHGNRIVSLMLTMHDNVNNPMRLIEVNTVANTLDTWVFAPDAVKNYPSYTRSYAKLNWIR